MAKVRFEIEEHKLAQMQHFLLGLQTDQLEYEQESAPPERRVPMWLEIEVLRARQRKLAQKFMQ